MVLVTPDRTRQSAEEVSVKVAYRWSAAESNRFWIVRPWMIARRFESRAGCPDLDVVRLPAESLWLAANDRPDLPPALGSG